MIFLDSANSELPAGENSNGAPKIVHDTFPSSMMDCVTAPHNWRRAGRSNRG